MHSSSGLTTAEVLAVFTDEVAACGGRVTDTFNDGRRLFTRSVFPGVKKVRPADSMQRGVALKATETDVWVFPYLFRLVCRNGAITAKTLASRSLDDLHLQDPEIARQCIREGVVACSADEVFSKAVRRMRSAGQTETDLAISQLPLFSQLSRTPHAELLSQIVDRFFEEGDRSQFGLANAITSVARDTNDPDLRWNLEELGGTVIIGRVPKRPKPGRLAAVAG